MVKHNTDGEIRQTMLELLIFAITYLLIAFQKMFPKFDRASIALIGATAMIACGVLSLKQAVESVDYDTIVLLFGMMVVSSYLGKSGFFDFVAGKMVSKAKSGRKLLLAVVLISGFLSAFLVNDVVCIFMTPIVVRMAVLSEMNPIPLLLALSTSANIGSCATIVGNPQNMLIAMKLHIPFTEFLRVLLPVSLVSLFICYLTLLAIFGSDVKAMKPKKFEFEPDKPMMIRMLVILGITVFLFVSEVFPPPVAALIGATLAMVFGGQRPKDVMRNIDWNLLVFFAGLFVVVAGFEKGGWMKGLEGMRVVTLKDYVMFSGATVILSNLISNVPFVMVALPMVKTKKLAYLLAMASTFAGNLTLIGSVANVIVAETADSLGVRISFGDYLKIGLPLTLITVAFGTVAIYFWG